MRNSAPLSLAVALCLTVACGTVNELGVDGSTENDADSVVIDASDLPSVDADRNQPDADSTQADADPDDPDARVVIDAALPDAEPPDADPNACSNEGGLCGPMTVCGSYGACSGFSGTCDNTGTQSATCTDHTCVNGQCVAGAPYTATRNCSRNTNGTSCGQSTSCGSCTYENGLCDNTGSKSCTTTFKKCQSGSCQASSTSGSTQTCSRNTDGNICGATPVGCPSGSVRDRCCSNQSCSVNCGSCE
jgi:hypothetical protein